jgi:hydroxybutyrate-dimer hydrolase
MKASTSVLQALGIAVAAAVLTACGGQHDAGPPPPEINALPTGVTHLTSTTYAATAVNPAASATSAATQDLLTGGLGKSGLQLGAAAASYANALAPTAVELRRAAIQANYRAILDASVNGGYGTLYGPNVDATGAVTANEGLIPGKEYLGYIDDGSGMKKVVMAVQIPSSFDVANPCIVAGPSSGSRGVYGSIATASEWGLKHNCAVALTDAGKGTGLYDPMDDTVNQIDGTRATRTVAGALSFFAANISDSVRSLFNTVYPNRLAIKHAHSQTNPEKDWGTDTLTSIKYALYALNQEYGTTAANGTDKEVRFKASNTLVIAGSVSNGGAAVLHAAEQDTEGLIDGVVANEPSAQPSTTTGYGVTVGGAAEPLFGKPLVDVFTYANIYQPCAVLAPAATMAEVSVFNYMTLTAMNARAANRCAALAARGLVTGATTSDQAIDALAKLRAYGYTPDNVTMHNHLFGLGNSPIIAMMYTNAFGRFSMIDNLCGMSAAQVDASGNVVPVSAALKAQSFAGANGTLNGAPASVVLNDLVGGGGKSWQFAVSPTSGTADFALDAALCQRSLVTGMNATGTAALTAATTPTLAQSQAVQAGMAQALLSGNLHAKPTLIVAGRSDGLVPINHSERAYTAFNKSVEGAASQLSYIEVFNGQHFDTFLNFSGFDTRYIPLHVYYNRAMDAMYAKLKNGTALPPSQVVRTTVRGGTPGAAPAITATNVPNFVTAPAAADSITIGTGNVINMPN